MIFINYGVARSTTCSSPMYGDNVTVMLRFNTFNSAGDTLSLSNHVPHSKSSM